MTNCALLCLYTTIASMSLLVTCAKMTTEIPKLMTTTEATKASDDSSKMIDNSKSMVESKSIDDAKAKDDMDLMAAIAMCNDSFRIEMSFLISLNESGSFPDETDKTPKCFLRCVLQSLEIASLDDGKIDPGRAAAIFADERDGEDIKETATFCAQRDEKCQCEKAYNFLKCLFSMEIEKNSKKTES